MSPQEVLTAARNAADSLAQDPALMRLLRDVLVRDYPTVLTVLLALTVLAVLAAVPALARAARRPSSRFWMAALLLTNAGLALRLFWVPHEPQVYHDEIFFLNTADNLARHGVNALSATEGETPGAGFHPCPIGWQYLVSRVYLLAGVRPELAFDLAAILSGLTVPLLALLVRGLTGSGRAGLMAGLLLAVLPVHLRLAGSAALETASLFFLVAGLLALLGWMRGHGLALLALATALLAWFLNMRMENAVALAPLVFLYFAMFCPSERLRGWGERLALLGAGAALILCALPALLADCYGVATRFYYFYEAPADIQGHVSSNLRYNFLYFVEDAIHPAAITVLALIGLATCGTRTAVFWLIWWAALTMFYSLNPSCDFSLRHTLDSWRTALHPTLGLVVLAGMGAAAVLRNARLAVLAGLCVAVPFAYGGFIQARHLWMVGWEAQSSLRDLLRPGDYLIVLDNNAALGSRPLGVSYQLACTTGQLPRFFIVDPAWEGRAGQEPPQITRDVATWTQVEKRRVFLYHLHTGSVVDERDRALLGRMFALRAVAGRSVRRNRATFSLYQVGIGPGPSPPQRASPASLGLQEVEGADTLARTR